LLELKATKLKKNYLFSVFLKARGLSLLKNSEEILEPLAGLRLITCVVLKITILLVSFKINR